MSEFYLTAALVVCTFLVGFLVGWLERGAHEAQQRRNRARSMARYIEQAERDGRVVQ
jgi:uncharacterized membrane protein YciS (DUF1049 family)